MGRHPQTVNRRYRERLAGAPAPKNGQFVKCFTRY